MRELMTPDAHTTFDLEVNLVLVVRRRDGKTAEVLVPVTPLVRGQVFIPTTIVRNETLVGCGGKDTVFRAGQCDAPVEAVIDSALVLELVVYRT